MRILFIGGTRFVGRHLVEAARVRQHEVTVFHRGRHAAGLPAVEEILGDRNTDLARLQNRCWDAVVDICGYLPHTVQASAAMLRNQARQYVFISSVAAYADFSQPNYSEASPVATLTSAQRARAAAINPAADLTAVGLADLYGALKAQCEQEVRQVFGHQALVVRPGLLAGPLDPTDRFTYWASRVARGGEVLAPGHPNRFVQFLDARDLATWTINLVERRAAGTYNAAIPPSTLTFGALLDAMRATSQSETSFTWVSEEFLSKEGVAEWSELPLYLAESDTTMSGFLAANVTAARTQQLTFRPLAATIQDTLAWRATQPYGLRAGIDSQQEQALLRKWHAGKHS